MTVQTYGFRPDLLVDMPKKAESYNKANSWVQRGSGAFLVTAIFAALSQSTPLGVIGGAVGAMATKDQKVRMLGFGVMLSAVMRVAVGSLGAYIMTAGALFALMRGDLKPSKETLVGIAGIFAIGSPLAVSAVALTGAAGFFIYALHARSERAPEVQAWSYLKEKCRENLTGLQLQGDVKKEGWKAPLFNYTIESPWLDRTYNVVSTNLTQQYPALTARAIQLIVGEANHAREAVHTYNEKAMFAWYVFGLSGAATLGALLFPAVPLALAAGAAAYIGRTELGVGLGIAAGITLIAGSGSAISLLAVVALGLSTSKQYSQHMPVALCAIGGLFLMKLVSTGLFVVMIGTIPYGAWQMAQKEKAMEPINTARLLSQMGAPIGGGAFVKGEYGEFSAGYGAAPQQITATPPAQSRFDFSWLQNWFPSRAAPQETAQEAMQIREIASVPMYSSVPHFGPLTRSKRRQYPVASELEPREILTGTRPPIDEGKYDNWHDWAIAGFPEGAFIEPAKEMSEEKREIVEKRFIPTHRAIGRPHPAAEEFIWEEEGLKEYRSTIHVVTIDSSEEGRESLPQHLQIGRVTQLWNWIRAA